MDIIVLVKNVPEVAEAELEITPDESAVDPGELVFGINEWDNYAVEEAVRLKEELGGSVTVMTLGDEEAEDVLRRSLAMGADRAVHLCDEAFDGTDPAGLARAFARAIGEEKFDLILTGVQSSDTGQGQTGVLLSQLLGLAYATMAVKIEVKDQALTVWRELEDNTQERVALPLPALVTVQSGINQPRYVSIMGIRKARQRDLAFKTAADLDLAEDRIGPAASHIERRRLSLPDLGIGAEMLEGSLPEVCRRAAGLIKEKGGLS